MNTNLFENTIKLYTIEEHGAAWRAGDELLAAACAQDFKKAAPEKLAAFLTDAASKLDEQNLLNLLPGEKMPADARVGIVYQPSYAAAGAAIYARNEFPELISEEVWQKLSDMCNAAFDRGFHGHGFEFDELQCRVMLMLCGAGVKAAAAREQELFGQLLDFAAIYCEIQVRTAEVMADEANPNGKIPCFHDWGGSRAGAYVRQFCAAWDGKANTVFVYGTLMHGEAAEGLLKDAAYLGEFTLNGYEMFDLGGFPGIRHAEGGDSICGEVYCVDDATLARLDQYEGEGSLYLRKNARVHGSYGAVTAMFYEYAGELCGAQRIDGWRDRGEDRVWYAAYGSNLQADRFRCYLQGGTCKENGRSYPGCSDKTLWKKSKVRSFKGRLYFGNRSSSWNHGGVAFFAPEGEGEVWMRLYRISRQQLLEIQQQEGCSDAWYGNLVFLGTEQDDRPVYTFTSAEKREKHAPDSAYLELIRTALMKECGMNKRKADRYLAKACE